MNRKLEIGRLLGIPILIDSSLLVMALLWILPAIGRGSSAGAMAALMLLIGIFASVLLHELGHALAGRVHGVRTSHIELNCLGGLCFWADSKPRSPLARIEMILAGPAVNFALFVICDKLAWLAVTASEAGAGLEGLAGPLWQLSSINFMLLWFNLLPSHPLDGGRALAIMLGRPLGSESTSDRVVAYIGMVVTAAIVIRALQGDMWLLLMAIILFVHNRQILEITKWPPQRRAG